MAMRWYREHADTIAACLALLASVVLLASLVSVLLSPSARAVLASVLSSVGTLLVAIAAILGLRTWKRQASRTLAQRLLRAGLVLADSVQDSAIQGASSARVLAGLIDNEGKLVETPWSTRMEALARIEGGLRDKRSDLQRAKLEWSIAVEEAKSSSWLSVADEAVSVSVSAMSELLSAQLLHFQTMAGVWQHCDRVAMPEKRKMDLKSKEEYFDRTPKEIGAAVEQFRLALRPHLGL